MSLIKSESHFWNCTVWVILKQPHTMCVHVLVGLLLSPQRNTEAFHSFSCHGQTSTCFIHFQLLPTLLGLLPLTKSLYILQRLPEPSLPLSCPFLTVFWSSSVLFLLWTHFMETWDHVYLGKVYLGMKNGLPFMRLHSAPLCQSTC